MIQEEKMNKKVMIILLLLVLLALILIYWRCQEPKHPPILLTDSNGNRVTEFQISDSIFFSANSLKPRTGYTIQVLNTNGETVRNLELSTDQRGIIPETVLWYNVGVRPCKLPSATRLSYNENAIVDNTDYSLLGQTFTIQVSLAEDIVQSIDFSINQRFAKPILYAADSRGCMKSGFLIGEQDVWVVGKNFPKGSIVRLWAVTASSDRLENTQLTDQTKQYRHGMPPIFELKTDETNFKKLLWPKNLTTLGSYDIVAEVVQYDFAKYRSTGTAKVQNVVSYETYAGFVIQRKQNAAEPLEMDIAGKVSSPFTFRNTFLTTEDVYVGVDPGIQPSYVGQTAKIFIVQDKNDAQWTVAANNHTDLNSLDMTGHIETLTVGGICGNCWKTLAWPAPLTPGKYDVVLDFNMDDQYTPGVDLIDSLNPAGFIVSDIRVDNISFNYSGSGAITIYDNENGIYISPPEYYSANHLVKPAAWPISGPHTVEVEFKAVNTISSAEIWAEGALLNLNSNTSPKTVSFSGGTGKAVFTVNNSPNTIGKYEFFLNWKYQNINNTSTGVIDMGETGNHLLYTTYATPNAPMNSPWLEVLEFSTAWASGESDIEAAREAVVSGLNAIDDLDGDIDYVISGRYTSGDFSAFAFDLSDFLSDLKTMSDMVWYCADAAGALQIFSNALGLDLGYVVIDLDATTNFMDPMGNGNPANGTDPEENWQTIYWSWHCIGWRTGDIVYDACLHLDGNGSPASAPFSRLIAADMPINTYGNYLMPSLSNFTPTDINVVALY
jgi:hypothetical protein